MIIINDIDSNVFHTAEYDEYGGFFLYTTDGHYETFSMSDSDFQAFAKNRDHDACLKVLVEHPDHRFVRDSLF